MTRRSSVPTPSIDAKPLYALAGAGEAAVSALRARVNNLPDSVKSIQTTAQQNFQTQVKALPTLVQGLPTQIADLRVQVRKQVIDLASKAEAAYDDFAAQGEKVVAARRGTVTRASPRASRRRPRS